MLLKTIDGMQNANDSHLIYCHLLNSSTQNIMGLTSDDIFTNNGSVNWLHVVIKLMINFLCR